MFRICQHVLTFSFPLVITPIHLILNRVVLFCNRLLFFGRLHFEVQKNVDIRAALYISERTLSKVQQPLYLQVFLILNRRLL